MKNKEVVGKYIIVKELDFNDFMKDEAGKIKIYNTFDDAAETCGMYEFEDVLILKVLSNYVNK